MSRTGRMVPGDRSAWARRSPACSRCCRPALAHPNLTGVVALLGVCAVGGLVYAALGAVLGVVRLSELRFLMRRQPGVRPADPTEQP